MENDLIVDSSTTVSQIASARSFEPSLNSWLLKEMLRRTFGIKIENLGSATPSTTNKTVEDLCKEHRISPRCQEDFIKTANRVIQGR